MGIVIDLASHPAARRRRAAAAAEQRPEPVAFFFDVASPYTYLAAERVERAFPDAAWVSVCPLGMDGAAAPAGPHPGAEGRAEALGLPLVWPDLPAIDGRRARRAAAFAARHHRAPGFVTAAARLAYAGGFDLDDPAVVAEAAAAAGLALDACLDAAEDPSGDDEMIAAARRLDEAGAGELPVLDLGGRLFAGERRVPEAVAAAVAAG
jgi:2-hydroxychromene-2-carboxylate isomerase